MSINIRELICLSFALDVFGHRLTGQHIWARCDNEVSVTVVYNLYARHPILVLLVRHIHAAQARWDVTLTPLHIEGVTNVLADLLSRNEIDRFLSLVPTASMCVQVPVEIRNWLR